MKSLELEQKEKQEYQRFLTTLHRFALFDEMYQTKKKRELAKYHLARHLFFEHFYPFLNEDEIVEIFAYDQLLQSGFIQLKGEKQFRRIVDIVFERDANILHITLDQYDRELLLPVFQYQEEINQWKEKCKEKTK